MLQQLVLLAMVLAEQPHPRPARRYWRHDAAALANRIGVTWHTVNAIELGKYSPSLDVAFRVAAVFAVPIDEVFQFDGED